MGHNVTRGVFYFGNYRIVVSEILCSNACPFAKIVLGFSNSLPVIICFFFFVGLLAVYVI